MQNGLSLNDLVTRLTAQVWWQGRCVNEDYPVPASVTMLRIVGLATLANANAGHLAFLANPKYRSDLQSTQAGAVLLREDDAKRFDGLALVVQDPYLAYARASHWFVKPSGLAYATEPMPCGDVKLPQVHPTVICAPSAIVDPSVVIGPYVTIGPDTRIEAGVVIGANTTLGARCRVGTGTRLNARVVFYDDVRVGAACCIHSGAVLGADGFGFARTASGWLKIAQLGGVLVGDRVEIGANTCIDRGALDDTVIEDGVIIDNHVQIAHNCSIGENTAIAGCVGIAGSTRVGANCTLAGQAGLSGHIELVSGTHVGMQAQVTRSIERPGQYASGTGLWPQRQWRRMVARLRRQS